MRDEKLKYLLVFPAIAVVFITAIWPLRESFKLSFTVGRLNRPGSLDRYLGFENYAWAFFDDLAFWNSVGVTAIYTVLTVGLATLLALGLALLLAPGGRFRSGVQTLLILPFAMSPALIGISFRFMFDPEFGLFDAFFGVLILPLADVSWLANPILAFAVCVMADVWGWIPFLTLVLIGGLASVLRETVEAAQVERMDAKQKRRITQTVQFILIMVAILVMMVPIAWIFMAAFKNNIDVFRLKLWFEPTFENFGTVFASPYHLGDKLLNSTIVAFFSVIFAIPIATMAAYSFSRFRLRGETTMLVIILATQFVPAVVIILPFFVMFRDIGLLDSRIGLIIVNLAVVMPFAIWMIKGFIDDIPLETEEAAMVDGSSRLQVIRNIVLPMAAPGLLTAGIFCFVISWNEFLFALILTNKDAVTLPIGLALFQGEEGDLWNLLSAAGIIIMLPMFILALIIWKYFVQGMTMGAVR